jgi:hypothetical protein
MLEPGAPLTWRRILVAGTRAYWINLLLLMALHILPPVAFLCPVGTGFVMGHTIAATPLEAVLIATVMGAWMVGIMTLVGGGIAIVSTMAPYGILAGDPMLMFLVATLILLHLVLFAGAGAMFGGHLARKERARTAAGLDPHTGEPLPSPA